MFSRRHPYLFFILLMTTIGCSFIILTSLILKIGGSGAEFVSGDKVGVIEITGVIVDSKEVIENIRFWHLSE